VIVAVALTVWAMATLPGALVAAVAPVWAKAGEAASAAAASAPVKIERIIEELP
jgi:hypothetical protein